MRFDSLRILLVDDNSHMRVLLAEMLRAVGVRHIFEALDGVEALAVMRRSTIDIVITDLKMGALNGIEMVDLIRHSPNSLNAFVPVIMVTGHSTAQYVQEARDVGVTEFLTKPVTARSLINRLTRVINNPRTYVRCDSYFGPDRRRNPRQEHAGPWRRNEDNLVL